MNVTLYIAPANLPVLHELTAILKNRNQSLSHFFLTSGQALIEAEANGTAKTNPIPLDERMEIIEERLAAVETLLLTVNDDVISHYEKLKLRKRQTHDTHADSVDC